MRCLPGSGEGSGSSRSLAGRRGARSRVVRGVGRKDSYFLLQHASLSRSRTKSGNPCRCAGSRASATRSEGARAASVECGQCSERSLPSSRSSEALSSAPAFTSNAAIAKRSPGCSPCSSTRSVSIAMARSAGSSSVVGPVSGNLCYPSGSKHRPGRERDESGSSRSSFCRGQRTA